MSPRDVIVLHDSYAEGNERAGRKPRYKERPRRVSRHDVLWEHVEPALSRPVRPWDRPMPRPMGARRRTHGHAASRRARKKR